mmetsp:Transcript_39086/g.92569  ORF Transcript_39086/g.92569 Transcript_39086/m.92569 type:complete len:209 (-) Transcript_39086:342-968(-)
MGLRGRPPLFPIVVPLPAVAHRGCRFRCLGRVPGALDGRPGPLPVPTNDLPLCGVCMARASLSARRGSLCCQGASQPHRGGLTLCRNSWLYAWVLSSVAQSVEGSERLPGALTARSPPARELRPWPVLANVKHSAFSPARNLLAELLDSARFLRSPCGRGEQLVHRPPALPKQPLAPESRRAVSFSKRLQEGLQPQVAALCCGWIHCA